MSLFPLKKVFLDPFIEITIAKWKKIQTEETLKVRKDFYSDSWERERERLEAIS